MAPPVFQHPVHINIYLPRAPGVEKKFTRPRAAQTLGPTSTPPNNWLEDASQKNEKHTYTHTHSQAVFSVRRGEFKSFERPLFLDNRAFFQRRENALMLFLVNDTGACCSHGSGKIPVVSTRPLGVF